MTKARGVFWLFSALALAGLAVSGLALAVVVGTVSFDPPATAALLAACRGFVLPDVTPASLLTLALASLGFAVLALAIRAAALELTRRRRFLRSLRTVDALPPGRRTVIFEDTRPQAFCTGLLKPRVYVSTAALDGLDPNELRAVLAHEEHHARARDPLRVFCVRVLAEALFFLPALRRLSDRYAALAELSADAAALRASGGDGRPLASALLAFGETPNPAVVNLAPERVDHLLGEPIRWQLPVAGLGWAVLALGGLAALAFRAADVSEAGALNLPLVAAQACMAAMVVVPVLIGAAALVGSRRLVPRR